MEEKAIQKFIKMFGCDTARISRPCGKLFLILGKHRNTKTDGKPGQWIKNGKPYDFDYTEERVVASGETLHELMRSAKEHKRLCGSRDAFAPWFAGAA